MKKDHTSNKDIILMGHGGGGLLTNKIIDEIILSELGNPILAKLDDGACITVPQQELVMTTDSYVINPVFFPGGDIGGLAVCGTVNDLTMQGAEPKYMSLALIIEEGLPLSDLRKIIRSIKNTSVETGVLIVTGDTKVIEKCKRRSQSEHMQEDSPLHAENSGIFINTTGIGLKLPGVNTAVSNARPGDSVIITGSMGDHGMAIMNIREGLNLESELISDVAPLWSMISSLLNDIPEIHCLRDPTRGGVAAALCDVAKTSSCGIMINESSLPVKNTVRGACDILGLDPLNVANEGKAIIICRNQDEKKTLQIIKKHNLGRDACVIGKVTDEPAGTVLLKTRIGGERIIDVPTGETLPRIC